VQNREGHEFHSCRLERFIFAASAAGAPIQLEAWECRAIPVSAGIVDDPSFHRILMNVIAMMEEIHFVANSMVRESALPYLALPANDSSEFVGVCAFDQLNCPLDCDVDGGSQQQMNMLGHQDKRVQFVSAFAAMPIEGLQEESHVRFDNEQPTAVPRRESNEIGSGWGNESSRLQKQTPAAESRTSLQTLNWHEWNSCPSQLFFAP
jgi:hypothetical protein